MPEISTYLQLISVPYSIESLDNDIIISSDLTDFPGIYFLAENDCLTNNLRFINSCEFTNTTVTLGDDIGNKFVIGVDRSRWNKIPTTAGMHVEYNDSFYIGPANPTEESIFTKVLNISGETNDSTTNGEQSEVVVEITFSNPDSRTFNCIFATPVWMGDMTNQGSDWSFKMGANETPNTFIYHDWYIRPATEDEVAEISISL